MSRLFSTQKEQTNYIVSMDVIDSSSSAIIEGNSAVSRTKTKKIYLVSTSTNNCMDSTCLPCLPLLYLPQPLSPLKL